LEKEKLGRQKGGRGRKRRKIKGRPGGEIYKGLYHELLLRKLSRTSTSGDKERGREKIVKREKRF